MDEPSTVNKTIKRSPSVKCLFKMVLFEVAFVLVIIKLIIDYIGVLKYHQISLWVFIMNSRTHLWLALLALLFFIMNVVYTVRYISLKARENSEHLNR